MLQWQELFKKVSLILCIMGLIGCAASEDEKIGDAQFCFDDIPITGLSVEDRTTQVNSCLSKLGTLSTKQAQLMRCSGNFLIEGFGDPNRIITALENMNNQSSGGGGSAGTVGMMSVLAFSSQSKTGETEINNANANATFAQQTLDYCNSAGNKGYIWIASFSNIASSLAQAGAAVGGVDLTDGLDSTELATIISSGSTASDAVLGSTASVAYETSCNTGDQTNADICNQLGAALSSGATNEEIGAALRAGWQ